MAGFPLRFAVLGDSIAYGTGAQRTADTLGSRLSAALTADGFDVALHVLASGYLATAAVLAVDPAPHRRGVAVRAGALAAGAAAHDVLAKWLYAAPLPVPYAAQGARLMWDGGTVVTLIVAAVLWRRWYTSRAAVRAAGAPTAAAVGPA